MNTLIDYFRADDRRVRLMLRVDAVATALAAIPMILAPELTLAFFDLGAIAPWVVTATGATWLAYALWLLWIQGRPLGRAAAAFGIFMMVSNSLELLFGPLLFATGTGPVGWALILASVLLMDVMTVVWLAVWREASLSPRATAPTSART